MIINNTPIEQFNINGKPVYVKREDLCVPPGAPPFSKMRGVWERLTKLKKEGVYVVGYVETSISMAGWGVAWVCKQIGLRAIIFDPQYRVTPVLLKYHRRKWGENGADICEIPAGRAKVNYYRCRKYFAERYGNKGVLLPLGLPFEETIEQTAQEWIRTMKKIRPATTIVCVGSGTIMAGLIKGMREISSGKLIGVTSRKDNIQHKIRAVANKAKEPVGGLFSKNWKIVESGYDYTDICECKAPFPCHPYYDRKAWQWLVEHYDELEPPVLFWNIGAIKNGKG